ncbi:WD repeat-containing protein 43 [Wyeomyia smithii]|uniref:WD repeat-containing protein 43 n=1 Tax=Wyeomyia smithii TaxID=174621 RepID=UPI002467C04D|nr:WD repeat-containing protein 43 [Wyeomyia smithii]
MAVPNPREFSQDGKYFAFINSQGKFVVYEVEAGRVCQEYIPNLHLNVPCTCFTWVEIGSGGGLSAKKKKKRASSGSGSQQTFVAFGTSSGTVALYGLASSKIEKTFKGAGHSGPITAICAEVGADSLYTAGADGKVIEWSLSQCEQKKAHNVGVEKLTCLAVVDKGETILTGARQLKLWDMQQEEVSKSFVGHTSNTVRAERVFGSDEKVYVLTTSVHDRHVSLWSMEGDGRSPVGIFTMDDAPEYISTRMLDSKLHLVTVSKSGMAYYYIKSLDKISVNKPIKANHTYEVALDTAGSGSKAVDRLPIYTASIEFSPNQEQLLVGYGTEINLKFEQITIEKDIKQNVIIREQKSISKRSEDKLLKTKTPTVDNATAEFLNPVNASRKSLKTLEIPMEARLENLALASSDSSPRGKEAQKNMAHLLIQGLHSKDAAILRNVFSRNDPDVIARTAERVPAQYVSVLLDEISGLMQKKTVHVATAICWLKALIHSHASQLMALGSENLLSNFGTCLGIIEYRVEHANSLSKLSGRLDLLVSQIDRSDQLTGTADTEQALVYQEEDDSDVDSVLGKGVESSVEDFDGDMDEENEDEDVTAGSFVRLRNGSIPDEDTENSEVDEQVNGVQEEESSDDVEEEEDDDEEMDVSD